MHARSSVVLHQRAELQCLRVHARVVAFPSLGRPHDDTRPPLSASCPAARERKGISGRGEASRLWGRLPVEQVPQTHCLTQHSDAVGLKEEREDGEEGEGVLVGVRQWACVLDIQERTAPSNDASPISRTLFAHGRSPGNCVEAQRGECEQWPPAAHRQHKNILGPSGIQGGP